jgi:hypothetical protein
MRELASSKGVKVKKIKFKENKRPLMVVECPYGHEWKVKPGLLKNEEWCPKCIERPDFIPTEYKALYDGVKLAEYSVSKQVKFYRRVVNQKLEFDLNRFVKEFMACQEVVMREKEDAYVYDYNKDDRCRALFPMIQAMAFVLLERGKTPLSAEFLKGINTHYERVKSIRKDLYETDKYKKEGMRFELKFSN